MKPPPIDYSAIDLFDLRVVPLRGDDDECIRLRKTLEKQAMRHSYIDGKKRKFRILAAPTESACVIVRVE
jgi:hypothetical protein